MNKKLLKNLIPLVVVLVAVLIAGAIIFVPKTNIGQKNQVNLNQQELQQIAQKAVDFINNNFLQGQPQASLGEVKEEHDLISFKVNYQGQQIDSYVTEDGVLFFPQAFNLEEGLNQQVAAEQQQVQQKSCEDITKKDESLLNAFVVSQCPFGLQMQRVLAEIVKNIPSLEENIKVKYIGSILNGEITAMHGTEEAQENLRQICLREETDKYWNYINCHIKAGEVDKCLTEAGVDKNQLNNCMADNNRGLKYAQEDFDLQAQHNVTGSPTLILNNKEAQESWFGGRTAEAVKTLLCCGFDNQPGVCSQKLDENQAAASYSEDYSSGSAPAAGDC